MLQTTFFNDVLEVWSSDTTPPAEIGTMGREIKFRWGIFGKKLAKWQTIGQKLNF
jgi:hypothetical protein